MDFDTEKQRVLREIQENVDSSSKGSIDEQVKELVDTINSHNNYFTTSSCAGRVVILNIAGDNNKAQSEWLLSSHELVVDHTELDEVYSKIKSNCWLKFEPCILHVCCRTIEDAIEFVHLARSVGFKRGGINSVSKHGKIMVEVCGVDHINIPLTKNAKNIISPEQLGFFIDEANKKMEKNHQRIERLVSHLKENNNNNN